MIHLPVFSLIAAMLLWASSFIVLKLSFQYYHPIWVIFGRMVVASLVFAFWIPAFRRIRFRKADIPILAAMALCEPCLYFLLEANALKNTSASQAGLITTFMPLLVTLGAFLFFGERMSKRALAGLCIAVLGVGLLNAGNISTETAPHPLWGNTLELLAMTCGAAYTLLLKRLSSFYSPFFLTALQAFTGACFYFPLLFLPSVPAPAQFTLEGVLSVVYLGLFITIGAYGLYNYGVSRISAGKAVAFINLLPVLTLFLAWMILDERMTPLQYASSALVIFGVLLNQEPQPVDENGWAKKREKENGANGQAL